MMVGSEICAFIDRHHHPGRISLRHYSTTADVRVRTVLDVLAGRASVVEAADRLGVSRQTVYNWRETFVAGGAARLAAPSPGTGDTADAAAVQQHVEALVRAIVDGIRGQTGDRTLPDMEVLEAIRQASGLPVTRFCAVARIPRRTYYAHRRSPAGRRASPVIERIDAAFRAARAAHPEWGARRLWAHLTSDRGLDVSLATVKRALARDLAGS